MFGSSGATDGQTGTAGTGTGTGTAEQSGQRPNADRVFGDVFEDVGLSSPPKNPRDDRLTMYITPPAPPARGRASSPSVGLARRSVWCWFRLHHCQRTRSCYGWICGKSTWSHQRCQGKECGCRVRRIRRGPEGRGA